MRYTQYSHVDDFLERMGSIFAQTEALNGLMFGVCLQLKQDLSTYGGQPLLAIVEDDTEILLAAVMTPPYKLQLCAPTSFSDSSMAAVADGLVANQWSVPAVVAEKHLAESFAEAWKTVRGCRWHEGMQQRIHELRHVRIFEYAPGTFRQATPQDMKRTTQPAIT